MFFFFFLRKKTLCASHYSLQIKLPRIVVHYRGCFELPRWITALRHLERSVYVALTRSFRIIRASCATRKAIFPLAMVVKVPPVNRKCRLTFFRLPSFVEFTLCADGSQEAVLPRERSMKIIGKIIPRTERALLPSFPTVGSWRFVDA